MTLSTFQRSDTREVLTFAYIRLSDDNDGTMRSPDTQWTGCLRVTSRFGVPVPPPQRVFTDRDLSASDPNVVRFDYVRMLKAIEALDPRRYEIVVLSYAQDRVFRQPQDWQRFVELMGPDNYDGRLLTDYDGNVDLTTNGGYAVVASYSEVKKTAKRSRDGLTGAAEEGRGHGPVAYGWTRIYDHSGVGKAVSTTVIVEAEAAVVRDAAQRVLQGDHLAVICRDLNAGNVRTPNYGRVARRDPVTREPVTYYDNLWGPQILRQLLLRKANKGIRKHTSGKGARKMTTEHKAVWPPILTDDVYDRVVAILTDPARRTTTTNVAKYLLSGIGTCGVCNETLRAQNSQSRIGGVRTPYHAYKCRGAHVVKSMNQTDEIVTTAVLHVLSQPEVRAALSAPADSETTEALGREAALLARRDEAADDYAEGRMTRATMLRITANIEEQLEVVRRVVNRRTDAAVYSELLAADADRIEATWERYPLSRKRSVIRALFTVKLLPTERRGKSAFDPSTVIVELRPMEG